MAGLHGVAPACLMLLCVHLCVDMEHLYGPETTCRNFNTGGGRCIVPTCCPSIEQMPFACNMDMQLLGMHDADRLIVVLSRMTVWQLGHYGWSRFTCMGASSAGHVVLCTDFVEVVLPGLVQRQEG